MKTCITAAEQLVNTHFNITLTDDETDFLLNSTNESEIVWFFTILVKYCIYKTKFNDECPSILTIPHFKNSLKHKITNQKIYPKFKQKEYAATNDFSQYTGQKT